MSPTDVDTMAILRARWSENFSGLAHCRERCADVGSVDTRYRAASGATRRGLERAPSD